MTSELNASTPPVPSYLRVIRLVTAGLAAASAIVYLLIGFGVLQVVEMRPDDPSLLWFGLPAAAAFAFGTVVMLRSQSLTLWALGAVFQVFTISAYFGLAQERTPQYEPWGILLRVTQLLILIALVILLARYPTPKKATGTPGQRR